MEKVEHCKELTETFKYFDKNGDGRISAVELGLVLRSLGIASSHEELEAMVREVDCDNDGFIDLGEFIKLNKLTQEATGDEHKTMAAAFDVFDINKDGYISAAELHRVLSGLGEVLTVEDCHVMIRNVDRNGDMLVDFSEFKYLMQDTRVF
jgi:calcium-binding protein CML